MGRLREINVKAQFAFSPVSTLIATGTAAGSLSDDLSEEPKIEIYDPQFANNDPEAFTLKPAGSISTAERCVSLAWGGVTADRPLGIIATAMDNGSVDLWDPQAILAAKGTDDALLHRGTAHTGNVRCVDFNSVQTNLLASAGSKGEFFVWDTTKPTSAPTAYKSTRLDEIVSLAWNNKVGHIIALGGKSGALSVWDLRKKSELIHIPTRYSISSIAWHPTEPTLLMTSSADDHNPVIQLWDLRNANSPKSTLSGHEKGVLSLSWCAQDADLLLSSGSDNRTLIWNPVKAEIVAELPASSQWVHKARWCKNQPAIVANATLDGKITVYSIQDTLAPATAPIVDETPAGDDFFDSIPKNFQSQSVSFTLKQTPKWLKRPIGATFGFGGILAQFDATSAKVKLEKHHTSDIATNTAKDIKESLSNQSISELCQSSQVDASDAEKQDWAVIETLTSEHARGALLKYLGFTKDEVEKEVLEKFGKLTLDSDAEKPETSSKKSSTEQSAPSDEPSVFGDGGDDDDFLGSINSNVANGSETSSRTIEAPVATGPFEIYSADSSTADTLITKAILTGQFDAAIDVCLKEDRMSDAFMLALCGGKEAQKLVQDAYFATTKVPYSRLLSSVIAGNLRSVVEEADLSHWKEILAILCNYAKPDDFSDLCEILGQRLETNKNDQTHATLCYLAGTRLHHLVRIWASSQAEVESSSMSSDDGRAPFEVHAQALSKLIMKISIFRKAVSFEDTKSKVGDSYPLAPLYQIYLEFAHMISAEGNTALAAEYVNLVPAGFAGVDALQKRLVGPQKPAQPAQKSEPVRPTGMRNAYKQPAPALREAPQLSHTPAQTGQYSRPAIASPLSAVSSPYAPASVPQTQPNPYAPPQGVASQQQRASPYAPPQQAQPPQQQFQQQSFQQQQQQQQPYESSYGAAPIPNAFGAPPRIGSNGPTILPAAQRKDITPWNDAPDVPMPAPRRPTPLLNRSAIASPFPGQTTPTLAGFGPPQPAPLAPPPKTRSPAPPRPQPAQAPSVNGPPQRTISNPYAPPPGAAVPTSQPHGPPQPPSSYAPSPLNAGQGPTPTRYNAAPPQPAQQQFAPPPQAPKASFPLPPKATGAPPKVAKAAGQSPVITSPVIGGGVVLSREPSRQGSPAPSKPEIPEAIYPAGDRSHISETDAVIVDQLSALLSKLRSVSPEKYRRPLEDTNRRLNVLFDQLNNTQLSPATLAQVHTMSGALNNNDWGRGYTIHMELTADKMHEVRDWITGIKTLIVVGKKSVEEAWE